MNIKKIKVKNTYNIKIKGTPKDELQTIDDSSVFIVNPQRIPNFKAKLLVKLGESVNIGTPIMTDKKQPHIKFLSPAAGVIKDVEFGDRRSVNKIVIEKDKDEKSELIFDPCSESSLERLNRDQVVSNLVEGGMWGCLTEFPFGAVPKPETLPPSIYVSIDYDEPFMPQSSIFMKEYESQFLMGLNVLKKLCDNVNVGISSKTSLSSDSLKSVVTHEIEGDYPANHLVFFCIIIKKHLKKISHGAYDLLTS